MKIAKINHSRCDEWAGYTLVWVPDYFSQLTFVEAVEAAQNAYMEFLKKFEQEANPPVTAAYGTPPYANYPDKKVSEVDALWDEQKRLYAEWQADHEKSRRGFDSFLEDEGMEPLGTHDPELMTEVDWGHRHGLRLEFEAKPVTRHRLVKAEES